MVVDKPSVTPSNKEKNNEPTPLLITDYSPALFAVHRDDKLQFLVFLRWEQ